RWVCYGAYARDETTTIITFFLSPLLIADDRSVEPSEESRFPHDTNPLNRSLLLVEIDCCRACTLKLHPLLRARRDTSSPFCGLLRTGPPGPGRRVVLCGQRGFVSGERFGQKIHTPDLSPLDHNS
ncbi:unnamed protein product, partial [Ectocarpus sp. 4 AP-2014]